jgi:predicted component of type VI protein secretion system
VGFARHEFTPSELVDQLAAERRGLPFLVYRDAAGVQHTHELTDGRVSVGREDESDLAFTWDAEVSRLHALLEPLAGSWTVVDDDLSRNGTFVNGVRVRGRRRLSDRDVLRFGATEVLYRNPGEQPDETPQVAGQVAVAQVTQSQHRVLVALCRPLLEPGEQAGAPPSNREIAEELTTSIEAVRSHLKNLFRLFGVPNLPQNQKRLELARRGLASGVVVPRDISR